MKLYIYDHCPFCVRARMMIGLHALPVGLEILLNDDEVTPIGLIGSKMVPILVKPDGTAMGESLDIVHWLDEYAGKRKLDETVNPQIQVWLDKVGEYVNKLIMPRDIQLGLPEFATQSAIDYFVEKKEKNIGSFADNLKDTAKYLAQLHQDLQKLEHYVPADRVRAGDWSMEDILLFPILRNLTMVKDLQMPHKVREYVEYVARETRVPLYFDRAC